MQVVTELIDVLEQENRVYDSILKISKNKTNVIVEGKISELENIIKLEQSLMLQMSRLENVREKIVGELAILLNIKSEDLTISELLERVEAEQVEKLKSTQTKLAQTINELKNSNEINSNLIKNSLDFINFSINIMSAVDTGNNNYGNTGHVNDTKKKNFFDMKL